MTGRASATAACTTAVVAALTGAGGLPSAHAASMPEVSLVAATSVVSRYFTDLEGHRYAEACSLLGGTLLEETAGERCDRLLRAATPVPLQWKVVGVVRDHDGAEVVVRLGQPELDHVRMRTWQVEVRRERGRLRIVATVLRT